MTDDISKVVREMRASSDAVDWKLREWADQIEAERKKGCECESMSKEVRRAWNKAWSIESAAAPVEVEGGMLPDALGPHAEEWYRLCERRFAVDRIGISGPLAEAIVTAIDTLARQLAEAKAGRLTLTQDYCDMRDRAEQAESQLAEATRRLAEVEVALKLWRDGEESGDYLTQVAARDARDALLTKEPTK